MKTKFVFHSGHWFRLLLGLFTVCHLIVPTARAGLTVDIHLYHDNNGYYFYPWLNTNATLPKFPAGNYLVASPGVPASGSTMQYVATSNNLSFITGGSTYYGDVGSLMQQVTNGHWSIYVTNSTSTNRYQFTVSAPNINSNVFAPVLVTFPTNNAPFITNQPTFTWQGPTNWAGTLSVVDYFIDTNGNYIYQTSAGLPPNQTSWPCPVLLPNSTNDFNPDYSSNVTAIMVASTPTNSSSQPISGWISTATLETFYNSRFVVGLLQGNLVVNGGFETGDFTGWTVIGGGNFVDDGSSSGIPPHSGTYKAAFGAAGEIDYISQTVPTTPGAGYLLSFWMNSPNGETPNEFQVWWNGTILFDETNMPATGWTNMQFVVTATGTNTVLQFGGRDDPSYLGLDDVSVTLAQVKEPVAHFDFDENQVLAPDVSGHGNNMVHAGNFGGGGPSISLTAVAGAGSISFDGGSYLTASSNLLSTLSGNFSVSLWLKTSQSFGSPGSLAWQGAGVVCADSPNGGARDLIPVALTGGQVAFNIGDGVSDNTLNSSATVNDNAWHHVVVTRSLSTGERQIFIDGALDNSDVASTVVLDTPVLLTLGAKADASNPDPASPDGTGTNGYQGLLDDIQIYNRVLSSNEVAFLHSNPGSTLAGAVTNTYPVDVSLQFTIIRSQDANLGEIYGGSVSFNSVSPAPSTTNSVHSPHDYFKTEQYPGGGSGSGAILYSLSDVINEFTNNYWTIYINQSSPTQQVYTFKASIAGLGTNLLKAVKVFLPTNGAVNIATNPAYYWVGPSNFTTLQVELLSGPVAMLPVAATNWPSAPALGYGTNRFDVDYTSNGFGGVTFTTPVDSSSNAVRTWSATVNLSSEAFDTFVIGAPAPLPVLLTNLARVNGNLQFSFRTLAGRPHSIQSKTNLVAGTWVNVTNFVGNGSLQQFIYQATNPPVRFFRVLTQ